MPLERGNSATAVAEGLFAATLDYGSGEGIASQRTAGSADNDLAFYTGFQPRITILNNGLVGIDTTAPVDPLDVNGNAGKPGGGSWSSFSDVRLKKNIEPLSGGLDKLLSLRGVTFEYKEPEKMSEALAEQRESNRQFEARLAALEKAVAQLRPPDTLAAAK